LSSSSGVEFNLRNSSGTAINRLSTNGNSFINGGNVGIGNNSPSATLVVGTQSTGASGASFANDNSIISRFGASYSANRVNALTVANTATAAVNNQSSISFIVASDYSATGMIATDLRNSTTAASDMIFYTYNSALNERMRITAAGNVQIANGGDLILGPASSGGNVTLFNDNGYLQCDTVATFASELRSGGITDNGAYNLQCNGTGVWGAGAYVNGSDIALKENILDIEKALDLVLNLKPKSFTYKEDYSKDQSIQTGFIAQDLLETLKDQIYVDGIVSMGKNHLNVAYQNLIPLLTKAIQELKGEIDILKNKN
jgi:hypothetical protein